MLTWLNRQIEIAQCVLFRTGIAERDVPELDMTLHLRNLVICLIIILKLHLFLQELNDTFPRSQLLLKPVHRITERGDRPGEVGNIDHTFRNVPYRYLTIHDHDPPLPDDDND